MNAGPFVILTLTLFCTTLVAILFLPNQSAMLVIFLLVVVMWAWAWAMLVKRNWDEQRETAAVVAEIKQQMKERQDWYDDPTRLDKR